MMPSSNSQPNPNTPPGETLAKKVRPPKTGVELTALIQKSQLYANSVFQRLLPLSDNMGDAPAAQLAKTLTDQRALTPWQADQLLAGRTSFFVSGFKLMQTLPAPIYERRFIAEQLSRQRLVLLKVSGLHHDIAVTANNIQHRRLIQSFGTEWDELAQCSVEAYTDAQRVAQLLENPNFDRSYCFEVVRQLFESFCLPDSLVLDWEAISLSDIYVDRYGEVICRANVLPCSFTKEAFGKFVVFVYELLQSRKPIADEILTVLASSCWHDGLDAPEMTVRKLTQQTRPLVECVARPQQKLSLEYLRLFIRKGPTTNQLRPENGLTWRELLSGKERRRSKEFLKDHAHPHAPQEPAKFDHQTKPRTRRGLPVKILVVLTAIILNAISYLHSHQYTVPLDAAEEVPHHLEQFRAGESHSAEEADEPL